MPGRRHDAAALTLCGWDQILEGATWIADTACIGAAAITPVKKTPGRDRLDREKQLNHDVSSLRSRIEHIIGHLKNWKILAKRYRSRLAELPIIIRIVTRLELHKIGWQPQMNNALMS